MEYRRCILNFFQNFSSFSNSISCADACPLMLVEGSLAAFSRQVLPLACFPALAIGSEWMGCQLHRHGIPPALSPPGESGRQPQPDGRRPVWLFQIRTQMVQTESLKSPRDYISSLISRVGRLIWVPQTQAWRAGAPG